MKKSITMTKDEWRTNYHGLIDENEDVKQFLKDYFKKMCGSEPSIRIVGKLFEATIAWVSDGCDNHDDCFVCVWWELDTNDNPDIMIEWYVWNKELRTSVVIA